MHPRLRRSTLLSFLSSSLPIPPFLNNFSFLSNFVLKVHPGPVRRKRWRRASPSRNIAVRFRKHASLFFRSLLPYIFGRYVAFLDVFRLLRPFPQPLKVIMSLFLSSPRYPDFFFSPASVTPPAFSFMAVSRPTNPSGDLLVS